MHGEIKEVLGTISNGESVPPIAYIFGKQSGGYGAGEFDVVETISGKIALARRSVNTAGKFSLQQIDDYVTLATQNKSASKVMLGKYLDGGPNSYIQRAGSDHTYFDMGATKWKEAEALVGKNVDEMWKINKEFIDKQKSLNKEFYFSQEPWKAQSHEYLSKEAEYLIDLGAKDFQKINADTWKVIW